MTGDEDELLRPVGAGMCRYESLIDGTLDLADIERMNEFLDMKAENQARYDEAATAEARRHG
jgi:hypothetical protein